MVDFVRTVFRVRFAGPAGLYRPHARPTTTARAAPSKLLCANVSARSLKPACATATAAFRSCSGGKAGRSTPSASTASTNLRC
jgi:hypothetical protein